MMRSLEGPPLNEFKSIIDSGNKKKFPKKHDSGSKKEKKRTHVFQNGPTF